MIFDIIAFSTTLAFWTYWFVRHGPSDVIKVLLFRNAVNGLDRLMSTLLWLYIVITIFNVLNLCHDL